QQAPVMIAERLTDGVDALNQAVVGHRDPGPDGLVQLRLADQPVGIGDQIAQRGERARTQRGRAAVWPAKRIALEIHLEAVDDGIARQRRVHPELTRLNRSPSRILTRTGAPPPNFRRTIGKPSPLAAARAAILPAP